MTLDNALAAGNRISPSLGNLLLGSLLVGAAKDKLQLVGRDSDCFEDLGHAELVVGGAVVDQLKRSLEVVKEAMAAVMVSSASLWPVMVPTYRQGG